MLEKPVHCKKNGRQQGGTGRNNWNCLSPMVSSQSTLGSFETEIGSEILWDHLQKLFLPASRYQIPFELNIGKYLHPPDLFPKSHMYFLNQNQFQGQDLGLLAESPLIIKHVLLRKLTLKNTPNQSPRLETCPSRSNMIQPSVCFIHQILYSPSRNQVGGILVRHVLHSTGPNPLPLRPLDH